MEEVFTGIEILGSVRGWGMNRALLWRSGVGELGI